MAGAFLAVREGACPLSTGLREGHAPPLHAFRQRPATREGRMPARWKTHCRGGFHIRPVRGAAGVPGTMQASSPTGVCYNTEVAVSRLAAGPPWFVGEGFIPPAGVCGAAGVAGGACPSPTCLPATTGHTGRRTPARRKPIVGADSISARGVFGAAGLPGTMQASSPTGVCYNTEVVVSRLAAGLPWFVGEGHGPPAGVRGAAGCGGMRASRPTVIL